MKKNAMLKIAAILMVAVLLTTCAISSTFAKYVATGTATLPETARVAKWGITISSSVDGIFAQKFQGGQASDTGLDVAAASGTDNLLAPGTAHGGTITATLTGTPEVAFEFKTDATVNFTGWTIDSSVFYCPLVVEVNNVEYKSGDDYNDAEGNPKTINSAANFAECIELAIEAAGTKKFAAGTAINTVASDVEVDVDWSWAFEVGANADAKAENNAKDNKLAVDGNSISISVVQSATQIQNYS